MDLNHRCRYCGSDEDVVLNENLLYICRECQDKKK